MTWKDLVLLCVVIVGAVLFLYGANYYSAPVGWVGLYIVIAVSVIKIVLTIWESSKKRKES